MPQLTPIVNRTVRELADWSRSRLNGLLRSRENGSPLLHEEREGLVCHCRRVEYATVRDAILAGATTVADLQRRTTACTRCFGCRFELERMLTAHLGAAFKHEATITLPPKFAKTRPPRPMYMPVLAGFAGSEVDTRVIVFNLEGPEDPVPFRADLLKPNSERVQVWNHEVPDGHSAIVDLSRDVVGHLLPDGFGLVKLILDTDVVGSLRPYFHFVTPNGVTSTHEKKGQVDPNRRKDRKYHWIFPIGVGARAEEAYFLCTNTQTEPMVSELIWENEAGETASAPVPTLELDQTACVALHECFPAIFTGAEGGAVRLSPATHTVAGFMVRHDRDRQLWRVQHL